MTFLTGEQKSSANVNDSVNEYQKTNTAVMLHIVLHVVRVVNNKVTNKTLQKYNKLRTVSEVDNIIHASYPIYQSQQNVINK